MFYYVTARENGILVGCSTYFLTKHLHAKELTIATNNFFYVRSPMRIKALLEFTAKSASFKGADYYEFACNIRNKKMHKLLSKHCKFNASEVLFSKKLEQI